MPRSSFALVALPNGKVLAIGGPNDNNGQNALASCEIYHPVAQTWSPAASMPSPRQSPAAVAFGAGRADGTIIQAWVSPPATQSGAESGCA